MGLSSPRKQTVEGVLWYIAFAMVVFVVSSAMLRQARGAPVDVAQSILTGVTFGVVTVAMNYRRLTPDNRLPPIHAIGLGLFNLALIVAAFVLWAHEDPATVRWRTWVAGAVLSVPAVYLIAAGTLQLRRSVHTTSPHGDGT